MKKLKKAQARLAQRVKRYEDFIRENPRLVGTYHRPGSMNRRKQL